MVEALWRGVTPRTRVICLSHITSITALILPIAEMCQRARQAGILTVVDGAHAPGQIPLDLAAMDADFYTGNCHKWLCAPKGAGFLYARRLAHELIDPLVVSWGWQTDGSASYVDRLEWQGTRDIAAYLSVPAAISFQAAHDWPQVRAACHALLRTIRHRLEQQTGVPPICPDSPEWYAQMASLPLPPCDPVAFQRQLWEEARIEVPIVEGPTGPPLPGVDPGVQYPCRRRRAALGPRGAAALGGNLSAPRPVRSGNHPCCQELVLLTGGGLCGNMPLPQFDFAHQD